MGGSISVGIQRIDGDYRTFAVETNSLDYWLQQKDFRVDGSLTPFDRFLNETNNGSAEIQENVPSEYGYVLVDEVEHVIHVRNDFSMPHWVVQSDVGYDFGRLRILKDKDSERERAELRRDAIRVRYNNNDGDRVYVNLPPFTTDENFEAYLKEISQGDVEYETLNGHVFERRETRHLVFEIAFPAWKIIQYPELAKGYADLQSVLEVMCILTANERRAWALRSKR